MEVKDVILKIKTLVEAFGVGILMDTPMIRKAIPPLDPEVLDNIDALLSDIKQAVLMPSSELSKDASLMREIINMSKDPVDLLRKYSLQETSDSMYDESVKMFLSHNMSYIKAAFLLEEPDLHPDVQVIGDNGRYCIYKKEGKIFKKVYVTNFQLYPISKVILSNKDIEASMFNFRAVSAINGTTKDVVLLPSDFDSVQTFQKAIQRQTQIINPQIHDLQSHMRGMAYLLTERSWQNKEMKEQQGTTVLGYERFSDDGAKYMCTVDGKVYASDGRVSEEIVFIDPAIRLPEGQSSVLSKYGHMGYDLEQWKETTRFLLANVMKLNKKDVMANIAGWFFANTQEYNVRSVLEEFPLLHIAGPRSSGKSLTVSAIKQYFGHKSQTPVGFPTPPILAQDLTLSYTIPAIYDEYGGSDKGQGWSDYTFNEVHRIMKHVYSKTPIEKGGKGDGGQGRFIYKTRNSLCTLGQVLIRDQSISTRAVQVSIDGSIKGTTEGDMAYESSRLLLDYENKDFITGYTLWCMNQDDNEIKNVISTFRSKNEHTIRASGLKYDERQQQNDVAIQLGLHLMLKLGKELGVDVGFDEHYINDTVLRNAEMEEAVYGQTTDDALTRFIRDWALHLKTVGNSRSITPLYGRGGYVINGEGKDQTDPGMYGRNNKSEACVFDKAYIGIKIRDMVSIINNDLQKRGKDAHDYASIQPYLLSAFNKSLVRQGDGLILAPDNYRVKQRSKGKAYDGYYTLFNAQKLADIDEVFLNNTFWTIGPLTNLSLAVSKE